MTVKLKRELGEITQEKKNKNKTEYKERKCQGKCRPHFEKRVRIVKRSTERELC